MFIEIIICYPEDRETLAKSNFSKHFFMKNDENRNFPIFLKSIENINVSFPA